MAEKWADYLITHVRYDVARKHIQKVRIVSDNGDSTGAAEEMLREKVARLLKQNVTFVTAPPASVAGKIRKGADVHLMANGFIRTDSNSRESDNLGELPEF